MKQHTVQNSLLWGRKGRVLRKKSSPFQMGDLAKNPSGTMRAPTAGGVMKDPDLSKAALITAEQILQEACQQVLQNFNSFLDTLISLDERQCIRILVLSRFADNWQKCGAQNWDKARCW